MVVEKNVGHIVDREVYGAAGIRRSLRKTMMKRQLKFVEHSKRRRDLEKSLVVYVGKC